MPTLSARTLITAIGTIAYPVIEVDSAGLITDISSDPTIRSESTLTPTFVDIHIHGAAGQDIMHATPAALGIMQRFLARRGTARYLPTTVTASIKDTLQALNSLAEVIEAPTPNDQATPIGIHLEGPFLSHAKRGVHSAELLQPPTIALFDRFQQAACGHIRLITLAPEVPSALELIAHATQQGIRVSLGHSNATAAETQAAIAAGATSATHTFNAMRPLDHRESGSILGTVLDDPSLFADLICDGIHVTPTMVRLWWKLKQQRAILITDAIAATGMPDGPTTLAGLPVTVANGRASLTAHPQTLAGSVLTLDRAVANLMRFTGCALEDAVRAASSHPLVMLGLDESTRPGQPASFNQFSPTGELQQTFLFGQALR